MIPAMTMNVAALKAAALCTSKDKEAKLAFTFARIEWDGTNLVVVAMDSTHIFCARVHHELTVAELDPFVINIPATSIAKLPKAGHVTLYSVGEGAFALGDVVFTSVDSRYPKWRDLVPASIPAETLAPVVIDPAVGEKGKKALATYHGVSVTSQSFSFGYYPAKKAPSLMFFGDEVKNPSALFLMLPLRRSLPPTQEYIPPAWAQPTFTASA